MQRVVPGIGDERHGTPVACWRTLAATTGRAGSKLGSACLDREVLVEDPEQPPEVGVAPLAPGALALLDDRVDGALGRREVGDRDELLPPEVLLGRLGVRRPDEQALGAEPAGQVLQAGLDRPVELADRVELLQMRDDLVLLVVRQRDRLLDRLEALGILDVHALGPLEEGEVAERGLAERAAARSGRRPGSCRPASGSSGGRGAVPRRRP